MGDIAAFIKKEFDKKYNPTWHAIVGRNFGSYVTHETKHFIYFYLGQVAACCSSLVKSVVERGELSRTNGPRCWGRFLIRWSDQQDSVEWLGGIENHTSVVCILVCTHSKSGGVVWI